MVTHSPDVAAYARVGKYISVMEKSLNLFGEGHIDLFISLGTTNEVIYAVID